jgi:hypothetical protein
MTPIFKAKKLKFHKSKRDLWGDRWYGNKFSFFSKQYCRDRFYYHQMICDAITQNP